MLGILFKICLFYVGFCLVLYLIQRQMIYYPDKNFPQIAEEKDAGFVRVATADKVPLIGWFSPPQDGKKTLLYFHGNAGHIGHRYPLVKDYINNGYGVLLAEYRGYGGNEGRPSEEGFYQDGRAYIEFLKAQGIAPGDVVFYGESIGAGVAVQMAMEYPDAAALLLVTPFAGTVDIAKKILFFVPVDYLMKDRFESLSNIGDIAMPKYFFMAGQDEIVPVASSDALFNKAREPKKRIDYAAQSHNTIFSQQLIDDIQEILDDLP